MTVENAPYTIVKTLNYLIIQPAAGADFLSVFEESGEATPPENFTVLRIPPLRKYEKVSEGGYP